MQVRELLLLPFKSILITSTQYLLEYEQLIRVDVLPFHDRRHKFSENQDFLRQLAASLRLSGPTDFLPLLPAPIHPLVLQFASGKFRVVKIGESGKLTAACSAEIDGAIRIVASPYLPDFLAMQSTAEKRTVRSRPKVSSISSQTKECSQPFQLDPNCWQYFAAEQLGIYGDKTDTSP